MRRRCCWGRERLRGRPLAAGGGQACGRVAARSARAGRRRPPQPRSSLLLRASHARRRLRPHGGALRGGAARAQAQGGDRGSERGPAPGGRGLFGVCSLLLLLLGAAAVEQEGDNSSHHRRQAHPMFAAVLGCTPVPAPSGARPAHACRPLPVGRAARQPRPRPQQPPSTPRRCLAAGLPRPRPGIIRRAQLPLCTPPKPLSALHPRSPTAAPCWLAPAAARSLAVL